MITDIFLVFLGYMKKINSGFLFILIAFWIFQIAQG